MTGFVSPAQLAHVRALSKTMRAEDRAELAVHLGVGPYMGLVLSLEHSPHSGALLIDNEVAAIFGVEELPGQAPFVWMLSGRIVDRRPMTFCRFVKAYLPSLLVRFPELHTAIDVRYEKALRWASRLGFELGESAPFGIAGLPFRSAILRAKGIQKGAA